MGRILAVDDELDMLALLKMIIEGYSDHQVTVTNNPLEATEMLENETFDAVLLDLMMPEMGGIEAFQIMRRTQPEVQVIFLTVHPSVSKGAEAMKLGAMDFLPKPLDMNELTEKIKQAKASRMILADRRTQDKIKKILTDKGW